MKQAAFLLVTMAYLTFRSLADPFWAVLMYYGLSVLRPQDLWDWALPRDMRWSLFAAMVAIIMAVFHIGSRKTPAVKKTFLMLVMIFSGLLFVSYLGALNHDIAAKAGWEYAKIMVMLIVAAFVVCERWHVRYLAWMIFVCLSYIAYENNALYVFKGQLRLFHHGFGGYDNNGAALVLAMVIPFCYFFFLAERRYRRWVYLGLSLPAIHAVMLSASRGAMLTSLVVGTGMLISSVRRRPAQTIGLAVVAWMLVLAMAGPQVRERFASIGQKLRDPSAHSRFESWKAGALIVCDYPVLGVGLRNANLLTHAYGADRRGRTIHNLYLQIAADAGIPAAVTFMALMAGSMVWLKQGADRSAGRLDDYEFRWHHYICRASFWSLVTFAFGGIFLSFEVFELCYLLMLVAATAPALASRSADAPAADDQPMLKPKPALLTMGDF